MRFLIVLLTVLILSPASSLAFAENSTARKTAQTLIDHLGGAAPWAKAQGARIMEVHISQWARLPYTHEVWMDFTAPRVLVRAKNQDLRQMRSMNLNDGWWIQEGDIAPYEPAFMEDEFKRWRASPYRVLHLIARNDPALSYEVLNDNTLQIAIDGEPVTHFELDDRGKPSGFRRYNDNFESVSMLEPLESYGDVKLWKETRLPGASLFRSLTLEFELFNDPPAISFDPPQDLTDLNR